MKHITKADTVAFSEILDISNTTLQQTLPNEEGIYVARGYYSKVRFEGVCAWLGVLGACIASSDAVTRAAHRLGIVASRERLHKWHFITSLAPLDSLPSGEDLVLDRTWGQWDPELYNSGLHPYLNQPFFGQRQELMDMLPRRDMLFHPSAVSLRQTVHTQGEPNRPHLWLGTTPQEVFTGAFPIQEVATESSYPGYQFRVG